MIIKDDKKLKIEGRKTTIMNDLTCVLEELKDDITKEEILLCVNLAYAEDQEKFMKDTIKAKLLKLIEELKKGE